MQSISIAALLGDKYSGLEDNELIEKLVLEVLELRQRVNDCQIAKPSPIPWHPPGTRGTLRPLAPDDFRPRLIQGG